MTTYAKMNPKVKQKWIAALRSGEYKQGKGWLRTDNYFCCLGVLCNIHAQEHPTFAKNEVDSVMYDSSCYTIGPNVQKWSNVSDAATSRLANMNDDEGKSFKQIANWIEKNL